MLFISSLGWIKGTTAGVLGFTFGPSGVRTLPLAAGINVGHKKENGKITHYRTFPTPHNNHILLLVVKLKNIAVQHSVLFHMVVGVLVLINSKK